MQIDLGTVDSKKELHLLLANRLGFPDFYGHNWDAFWDSITGLVEMPKKIEFIGTDAMRHKMPFELNQLQTCFKELTKELPEIECHVKWN